MRVPKDPEGLWPAGGPPTDPAFARATAVAGAVVVGVGALGTLWLRGWGRVGVDVPSVPYYFSFPFYIFPGPRLSPGWAAAALPVVGATVAAALALYRARVGWPARVAASAGLAAVLALAVARRRGRRRSTMPGSTRLGSTRSAPSRPSCASSQIAWPTCPFTPRATRPARWSCTRWSPGCGRG
jgi:hypothetical protein